MIRMLVPGPSRAAPGVHRDSARGAGSAPRRRSNPLRLRGQWTCRPALARGPSCGRAYPVCRVDTWRGCQRAAAAFAAVRTTLSLYFDDSPAIGIVCVRDAGSGSEVCPHLLGIEDCPHLSSGHASPRHRPRPRRDRRAVPQGFAPHLRDADPPARRLRARGGSTARRVPRGDGEVAVGRPAAESRRLAGVRRAASSPSTSSAATRASSISRIAPTSASRSPIKLLPPDETRRAARRRSAAPGVHLLPPGARARRAGRAHAARSLRPHHRGNRRGLPDARAHPRAAHRAREEQDPRREHSLRSTRARRSAGAARKRAARDLPGVQRGLLREQRRIGDAAGSFRRSDPPRPAGARAAARSRGARPAGADAAARVAARDARRRARASSSCSTSRTARAGTARSSRKASALVREALASQRVGPVRDPGGDCRGARRGAARPRTRTGTRSSGCTTCCCGSRPRPSWRSIAPWRWRCATDRRPASPRSTPCSPAASSTSTSSRMRPARTSAAAWAATRRSAQGRTQRAIELTAQGPARRFLEKRLAALPP